MRTGCICAGVILLGCTPHPEELQGPELAPAENGRVAVTVPVQPSPPDPTPEPVRQPESSPEPVPFPTVYCAYPATRWRIHIDPTEDAYQERARRLADRYPNANGVDGRLARSNLPEPWRALDAVTLVFTDGVEATNVRAAGVYGSPSGGAFTFVLEARASGTSDGPAVAIEGHPATLPSALRPVPEVSVDEARWAMVGRTFRDVVRRELDWGSRPGMLRRYVRWVEADLGGGIEGLMIHVARRRPGEFPHYSVVAASDGSADAITVPIFEGGETKGGRGVTDEAYYEAVAVSDLDDNGHDEVIVRENWYEGSYDWLVRYDDDEGLVATLLCGDAF